MDDLAHELGMSKKTLYVHFSSKDAIVDKIFEGLTSGLRAELEVITTDPSLSFVQRLSAMIAAIGATMVSISPQLLRDLQRFVPATYQKIDSIRAENIPLFFGRLIRHGIASGKVRPDIDADFATQFWLHAIRGLIQPTVLERAHLTPKQTLEKAVNLYFGGLLTPAGQRDYEKISAAKK